MSVGARAAGAGGSSGHNTSQTIRDARVRGRYLLSTRTAEGLVAAIREFQTAIAHDPTDPLSYAVLAEAYCALSGNEIWSPEDGFPKARAAASQAVALDERLAQAHAVLAMVHNMYDWDWLRSEKRFQTAISHDPSCATAHHWLGLMYVNACRPHAAHEPLRRAAALEPLSPAITANIGRPYLFQGEHDRAIGHFQKAFDLDSSFWMAHVFICWAHWAAGRFDPAVEEIRRAVHQSRGIQVTRIVLAEAYARAGDRQSAAAQLESVLADPTIRYLSPYRVARVYVALDQLHDAFQWFDRALADRSLGSITCLSLDPTLASIRLVPGFTRYLHALHQHTSR